MLRPITRYATAAASSLLATTALLTLFFHQAGPGPAGDPRSVRRSRRGKRGIRPCYPKHPFTRRCT